LRESPEEASRFALNDLLVRLRLKMPNKVP